MAAPRGGNSWALLSLGTAVPWALPGPWALPASLEVWLAKGMGPAEGQAEAKET